VPTNLNLVQFVLFQMPYDDYVIVVFVKKNIEYESMCIHIVMKMPQEICKTPLYVDAHVSIR